MRAPVEALGQIARQGFPLATLTTDFRRHGLPQPGHRDRLGKDLERFGRERPCEGAVDRGSHEHESPARPDTSRRFLEQSEGRLVTARVHDDGIVRGPAADPRACRLGGPDSVNEATESLQLRLDPNTFVPIIGDEEHRAPAWRRIFGVGFILRPTDTIHVNFLERGRGE
jgi:hypothetical protein